MNPIKTYASALSEGQYVPHAYSFRQLHGYEHSRLAGVFPAWPASPWAVEFSGDRPSPTADSPHQTIEQVINQGYLSVPESEPEFALIHDRKDTALLALDDGVGQIRRRYEIYLVNFQEIEQAKCDAINDLFAWEVQNSWPASSEQQYILTKRLQALYADQRGERVAAWRDISRLRQTLPETAQQYLSAHRKIGILDDALGDPQ
jgi:hypothetical protein